MILVISLAVWPVFSFAQTPDPLVSGAQKLVMKINKVIINPLIALMFAVALAYFIWGVVEYLIKTGSDEARSTGKQHMLWGIIGMAVMLSAYGIINFILNTMWWGIGYGY